MNKGVLVPPLLKEVERIFWKQSNFRLICAPTRTRTWNRLLKRQLLCQLSYKGKSF